MAETVDQRPRHQQIAADLRARIMSGDLPPGVRLDTTHQLMAHFGVTSQTVQRALDVLKQEGFLVGRAGVGVFVRETLPLAIEPASYMAPTDDGEPYRWMAEAEKRDQRPSIQLLAVEEVVPPAAVTAAFGLPLDALVIRRKQLLLLDDKPAELADVYFPLDLAEGTALADHRRIRGGAPKLLADLGYPPRAWVDELTARLATSEELELLELPEDVPVLRTFRVVFSDDKRPIEASVLVKGGHMYGLKYEQPVR